MRIKVKKLHDFAQYFDPRVWRNWRGFTYYRLFGEYFLIVERAT